MTDTLTLFDTDSIIVQPDKKPTIDEAFTEFARLNPWVYTALRTLALDMVRRGRKRVGIGALFEVLRWEYARHTDDPNSELKLNNDYRSRYSRLLMAQEPELAGVFETRKLTSRA